MKKTVSAKRTKADTRSGCYIAVSDLIPDRHPLRPIKQRADAILKAMSRGFSKAFGKTSRPSG